MLITLLFRLLIGAAPAAAGAPVAADAVNTAPVVSDVVHDEMITDERVAQVRLAEALGGADAIHTVTSKRGTITFAVTRGDQTLQLTARTNKRGEVTSLAIAPRTTADGEQLGGLSWLADELAEATAITRLVPDGDGAITIVTADGRRYMVIPGRGSGGANAAVEARWAAEWNR
jgi:hypothetical protein